jgi:FkbM family methyltransferase
MLIRAGQKLNQALHRVGLQLARYPGPADRRRRRLLERRAVTVVVDVGANCGQYGAMLRAHGYRGTLLSYEPLPDAFRKLRERAAADGKWQAQQAAVGAANGVATLHVAQNLVSSSILPMTARHVAAAPASHTIQSIEVQTVTLAEILAPITQASTLVKIDTQGYESQVLDGAGAHLSHVSLLEVELSLVELYGGQPLFREIDARLVAAGFGLVSIETGFFDEGSGELLQIDAIYANGRLR